MVKLFLDDNRMPMECYGYMSKRSPDLYKHYKSSDWNIVRSHEEFVSWIEKNGLPDLISFDHDLAHEHYSPLCHLPKQYNRLYDTFKQKTGLHSAKFLLNYCIKNDLPIPKYMVHSMNPTGFDNIHLVLHPSLN